MENTNVIGMEPSWVVDYEDCLNACQSEINRCPICFGIVYDDDAAAICLHCGGNVQLAGGWK